MCIVTGPNMDMATKFIKRTKNILETWWKNNVMLRQRRGEKLTTLQPVVMPVDNKSR